MLIHKEGVLQMCFMTFQEVSADCYRYS